MSPTNHVGKRLLPPIFLPSRIIALTFLTKNVSNKSAFFVQRAHPYRAFLRNHIRTNFRVFLRLSQCRQFREFLRLSRFLQFLHLSDCSSCFYAIRRVTILLLIMIQTNSQGQHIYGFSQLRIILLFVICVLINGVTTLCDCIKCWKYISYNSVNYGDVLTKSPLLP